ncbi:MAG TPA: hypothetical protein VEP28_03305 [Rubrobacter sp.]|nr:hypothetical protein [Rubrobacter sp.]
MFGLCADEICRVPLDEVVDQQCPLDEGLYRLDFSPKFTLPWKGVG